MGLKTKLMAYFLTFALGYGAGTVYAPAPKAQYSSLQHQTQNQQYNSSAGTKTLEERTQAEQQRIDARQKLLELMK